MLRAQGKQHEAEKKNAYNDFNEYKLRVKEREKVDTTTSILVS